MKYIVNDSNCIMYKVKWPKGEGGGPGGSSSKLCLPLRKIVIYYFYKKISQVIWNVKKNFPRLTQTWNLNHWNPLQKYSRSIMNFLPRKNLFLVFLTRSWSPRIHFCEQKYEEEKSQSPSLRDIALNACSFDNLWDCWLKVGRC